MMELLLKMNLACQHKDESLKPHPIDPTPARPKRPKPLNRTKKA